MAQNKHTSSMTPKHARIKLSPFRIEYETYINNRTGKIHNWTPATVEYAELFLEFLETERPEVLEGLLSDDGVNIKAWSDTELVNGRKVFEWTNVELDAIHYNPSKFCTQEIDRNKFPKINTTHRNDNEL